jgi:hypothetical protein
MFLTNLIYKTNGDLLGVILFIMLIFHFYYLDKHTIFTYLLTTGCVLALIVDLKCVYDVINEPPKLNH